MRSAMASPNQQHQQQTSHPHLNEISAPVAPLPARASAEEGYARLMFATPSTPATSMPSTDLLQMLHRRVGAVG
jgi:hypothetical protein